MPAPKLFISYCWSSAGHQEWVIELASELVESGVDVILDKWNLREGHDAIAFMEKMVSDPEIKKVAMICDQKYASKADGRSGGVGTETQIISKEVYENQAQDKFVAVLSEKDETGKPYLPTYYRSRIYIDLSEAEKYATEYERLLRWIFDKPLYVRPPLGSPPEFLQEGEHVSLGTTPAYRRCLDAIKNQKAYAGGAFDEYCNIFAVNLDRFRISTLQLEVAYDDALVKNIEDFLPFRNEALQLFTAIAQYSATDEYAARIHRLFEDLARYLDRPEGMNQWQEDEFDNYRFIIHELFLYVLAILIRHSRFERAALMLERPYYVRWQADYGQDVTPNFTVFDRHLISLHVRNQRLGTNRTSLRADLLKQRCVGTGFEFRELMQADFVAYIRAEIQDSSRRVQWVPETLVYLRHAQSPFEVFARCVSKAYFEQAKRLLGINGPGDLDPLLTRYQEGQRDTPKFGYESLNPLVLLGRGNWATRP